MTGLRHARGAYVITMDDDLQNPPEEVKRLLDHAQRAARTWSTPATPRSSTQPGATSAAGSPTGWPIVLDKPKGLYLSSFRCMSAFVVRAVTRYEGPFPYVDGLIMQVTQRIDSSRSPSAARRPQQLHAAAAGAAVDQHVRQFLGHAAAAQHHRPDLRWRARARSARCGHRRGAVLRAAAGLGLADGGDPAASGVQLMILGILGEYLGRLYLTANSKPQSIVKEVRRSRSRSLPKAGRRCGYESVHEPARH